MKKNLAAFLVCTLIISCSTFAQTAKNIILSVSGIEFDDANFTILKNKLKANPKAKNIEQSYHAATAKISVAYNGFATDLWDELPAAVKQRFKLNSIDANNIALTLKNMPGENNTNLNKLTTDTKSNSNCTTCYLDLCKSDGTKSFQGVTWYGINYDEGTYYYRCENGILYRKQIWVNGYGATTNIITDTILYTNKAVGYSWGWRTQDNTDYSMDIRTIIAKNIDVQIDGNIYKDVIVVNRKKANSNNGMRLNGVLEKMIAKESGTSINAYYYRGATIAKIQELALDTDPLVGLKQYQIAETPENTINFPQAVSLVFKGKIDPSIVGIWKLGDEPDSKASYYKFNSDGTCEFYADQQSYMNSKKMKCQWRVIQGVSSFMELMCEGSMKMEKWEIYKGHDLFTEKSTLSINGQQYFRADGKKVAW